MKPPTWDIKRGRAKGGGQSSKAKGRAGCLAVQKLLLEAFPTLQPDDVYVKTGSAGGVDIHLSPAATELFPFGIEVKSVEALNIWAALVQASINADDKPFIVFFKRANTPVFVALRADEFLRRYAVRRDA
jgi:hypothetical protein